MISKEFWDGLSDFWTAFENRKEIEDFWTGMIGATEESSRYLHLLYISKYLEYSLPVWDNKYINIKIIKDGPNSNKLPGGDIYPLPDYKEGTFDIPNLKCLETGQTFTQGSDYEILQESKIKFNTAINDYQFSDELNMYGDTYNQCDYTIYKLYRKLVYLDAFSLDSEYYHPFTYDGDAPSSFDSDYLKEKAILLKYMTWGIFHIKKQIPTVKNLKYLYNILYNLPFNYEKGTASISGNTCTIGDYTYYIKNGTWAVSDGDTVEKFQPLLNNVTIKDRISDPALIKSNFNALQFASSVIVDISLQDRSKYMKSVIDFYDIYEKPKNLNIKYNVS